MSHGYIYFRTHESLDKYSAYKMGRTENCISRDYTYVTGEIVRGEMIFIIEVDKKIHTQLEIDLQRHFMEYNINLGGGTEFYDKKILPMVEPYLKDKNINYRVLNRGELYNIKRLADKKNQAKRVAVGKIYARPKEHQK